MPPARKSTGSKPRASTSSARIADNQPVASSSKTPRTPIPPHNIPESLTPGYVAPSSGAQTLEEEERARLVYELVGFHPRGMLDDLAEAARQQIYPTIDGIETWALKMVEGRTDEEEREVNIGLHALETLLESHVDLAFDRFTSWALRNTFEVPADLALVLPWQKNLDFDRAEYVSRLPGGVEGVSAHLEDLREKAEQARKLYQRLELAESRLDRRLEIAKQRKAEVGFVKEIISTAGLQPLPEKASQIRETLFELQDNLLPMGDIPPPVVAKALTAVESNSSGGGTRAWELGRQAYLNWAVHRMLVGQGQVSEIPETAVAEGGDSAVQGDVEGMEALARQAVI